MTRGIRQSPCCLWKARPVQAAFFAALLWGLTAQGMGLLNKYSSNDDIFQLFGTGSTITSGRWMLFVLEQAENLLWGGHCSLPLFNGFLSLVFIGASAGLIASLLQIHRPLPGALLGAVMASFPTVTSIFSFMFTAHFYFLALFMITACAYLVCTGTSWKARVSGIVLGACAVGIYQAFLPVLPTVILLSGLRELSAGETKPSFLFRKLVLQAAAVVFVLLLYFAGSRFFLWKYGMQLDSYMGINQSGTTSPLVYLQRAGKAYLEFFRPTRSVSWDMYPHRAHLLYLLMLCANGVMAALLVFQTGQKNRGSAALMLLLLLLFPLGCNLIFVMSETVHGLMVYGQVLQAALLILLTDWLAFSLPVSKRMVSGAVALLLTGMCVVYARYDNQCYLKADFQKQEAISWNTALVAQIKSTEGYRDELPVAWVNRYSAEDRSLYRILELDELHLSGYESSLQEYINNFAWEKFLACWCGFSPDTVDPEAVAHLPEVEQMPSYPEDGSVRVLDGIVVVKF